ncbi:MAG: hypothetical protein GY868_06470 [Deltaproteobacteria bacterium]|nr:hypothetical protein [Deltaproteobacteria bacterium]
MGRLIWIFLLCVLLVVAAVTSVQADQGETLFVDKCCSCHQKGGEAQTIVPGLYASSGWKRFFDKNKHKRKKDISLQINNEELNIVKQYLIDHAADSDQPVIIQLK